MAGAAWGGKGGRGHSAPPPRRGQVEGCQYLNVNVNPHLHFVKTHAFSAGPYGSAGSPERNMTRPGFAPKQARSRQTHDRLIAAARELLNEKGLEAATV